MPDSSRERLRKLYQELSELTEPVCAGGEGNCRVPRSCCDPLVCELVMDMAWNRWEVRLRPTGHPRLPLMGPDGCIAAPHLRPICTMHVCCINSLGFKPGDEEWTQQYFQLRGRIETLEWEMYGGLGPVEATGKGPIDILRMVEEDM